MIKSHKDSVIVKAEAKSPLAKTLLSHTPYVIVENCDYPQKVPVVVLQVETMPPDMLLIEYVQKNKYIHPSGGLSLPKKQIKCDNDR